MSVDSHVNSVLSLARISQQDVVAFNIAATAVAIVTREELSFNVVTTPSGDESGVTMGLVFITKSSVVFNSSDLMPYVGLKAEVSVFLSLTNHQELSTLSG